MFNDNVVYLITGFLTVLCTGNSLTPPLFVSPSSISRLDFIAFPTVRIFFIAVIKIYMRFHTFYLINVQCFIILPRTNYRKGDKSNVYIYNFVSGFIKTCNLCHSEIRHETKVKVKMGDRYDYLFKIILVGDSAVGKSSIVRRFTTGKFQQEYKSTIGVDFTVQTLQIDGKVVKVST